MNIPNTPEEVSAQWLTEALHERGVLKEARVQSVAAKSTGNGGIGGAVGEHARLRLAYDSPEPGAPQSLYAKFSLSDPVLRAEIQKWRWYEMEVNFYDHVAAHIELRTPRCYYSALDDETGACILLLEDLAPARPGDVAAGCSPAQAKLAVQAIAKFHATFWESPQLDELHWLPEFNSPLFQVVMQRAWQPFVDTIGGRLPASLLDIATRFAQDIGVLYDSHYAAPQTFIHCDLNPENILFATEQGGVPLAVIDWQSIHRGRGLMDVAYLLVRGLQPSERKRHEMEMLHSYHDILLENGVQAYTFEQCLFDYRLNTLRTLHAFIVTIGLGVLKGDRLRTYYNAVMPRINAALTDLNVAELFPD